MYKIYTVYKQKKRYSSLYSVFSFTATKDKPYLYVPTLLFWWRRRQYHLTSSHFGYIRCRCYIPSEDMHARYTAVGWHAPLILHGWINIDERCFFFFLDCLVKCAWRCPSGECYYFYFREKPCGHHEKERRVLRWSTKDNSYLPSTMCSSSTQIFKMMMDDLTMWKSNIKFVSIAFC